MSDINSSPFPAVLKGILTACVLTFIIFTVYALLLTYTDASMNGVNAVMLTSTAVSCILCGFITGRRVSGKGILWGSLGGLCYILIMLTISISIGDSLSLSPKMIISLALSLCCGALGGVIGINTHK